MNGLATQFESAVAETPELAATTRQKYVRDVREFITDLHAWFNATPQEATPALLLQWWATKSEQHLPNGRRLAPRTMNRKVAAVRHLFSSYPTLGLPSAAPMLIPTFRVPKEPLVRPLTAEEVAALRQACAALTATLLGKRDQLVVELLLDGGLEPQEAAALTFAQLQRDERRFPNRLAARISEWDRQAELHQRGAVLRRVVGVDAGEAACPGGLSTRSIHAAVKRVAVVAGLGPQVGPTCLHETWLARQTRSTSGTGKRRSKRPAGSGLQKVAS